MTRGDREDRGFAGVHGVDLLGRLADLFDGGGRRHRRRASSDQVQDVDRAGRTVDEHLVAVVGAFGTAPARFTTAGSLVFAGEDGEVAEPASGLHDDGEDLRGEWGGQRRIERGGPRARSLHAEAGSWVTTCR